MRVLHAIGKALWRCELALFYTSVVATVGIMCLTSADALSRYLLNRPIIGAYEITEKYLMVAAIFLGLSYAYRGGVFIRVTFLVDRLPRPLKLSVNYAAHLVSRAGLLPAAPVRIEIVRDLFSFAGVAAGCRYAIET